MPSGNGADICSLVTQVRKKPSEHFQLVILHINNKQAGDTKRGPAIVQCLQPDSSQVDPR